MGFEWEDLKENEDISGSSKACGLKAYRNYTLQFLLRWSSFGDTVAYNEVFYW